MKKLENFLNKNDICFVKNQMGGNGVYIDVPVIDVFKIEISARDSLTMNAIDNFVKKSKRYSAIGRRFLIGCNAVIVYHIAITTDFVDYKFQKEKDLEKVDAFWKVYHNEGKSAADKFYIRNAM